ncbi:MAG: lipoyl(octanoyl) transferase LipB [Gammaproteobacteria bacterium]|nr:lipoyl(octanoyl) transferase LipB [Gammaproteobacteria bacterium]
MPRDVLVKDLGRTQYCEVFDQMRAFTNERNQTTPDEIWLTEHEPVFTQGQSGKAEHLLAPGTIPVVQTDRGGQVTYHGPGQIVAYLLFDIRRLGINVRGLVSGIENSIISLLSHYKVTGQARADAPGVYVAGAKVAALGLRVRRGCSYHGLSLNVQMDLAPFAMINPCGLSDVTVTQLADLGGPSSTSQVKPLLLESLAETYGINLRMSHNRDSSAA